MTRAPTEEGDPVPRSAPAKLITHVAKQLTSQDVWFNLNSTPSIFFLLVALGCGRQAHDLLYLVSHFHLDFDPCIIAKFIIQIKENGVNVCFKQIK